ncbi:MAG: hypothetical protein JWQ09_674 [Segetibacter sp.]|nr:hypothetical protein [Segetibacter sp.]
MKKYFFALVAAEYLLGLSVVIVFFLCATGCSVTSHVETAPGVNFNNYKTFGWVNINGEKKEDLADNDIVDNNIKNAISMELQSKGWKETNQNPDVILDYNVMVEKEVRQASEPVYNYPFTNYYYNRWHHSRGYIYYPNNLMGYHTYNIPFKQGTLTVNMIDTKTNKLIWQGSAQGDVSSKIVTTNEMQADVKSIFKKFDVPKTNA